MRDNDRQNAHRSFSEAIERLKIRNEEKRQIIALIAHDLKTPMSTIVSFCRVLRENHDSLSREELLGMVNDMEATARNGNRLLHDLLRWAARDGGSDGAAPEAFDIRQLADEVVRMIGSTAGTKRIAIRNEIEDGTFVAADRDMIDAVLRNLLSNAIKFSRTDTEIVLRSRREGDRAVILVRDDGMGIDNERLASIFRGIEQEYGDVSGSGAGSGLGLRISADFIRKNGGRIWADSAPGRGTAVYFSLPVYRDAAGDGDCGSRMAV